MEKIIYVPTYEYLKFGNIFSSSLGDFNFKIFPMVKENSVRVVVWKGKFCFENSEMLFCENFVLKDDVGLKIKDWLEKKLN